MRYYLKRGLYALPGLAAVLFVAFALTSQPLKPHPYFADDRVLVIAHRGGKGHMAQVGKCHRGPRFVREPRQGRGWVRRGDHSTGHRRDGKSSAQPITED